MINPNAQLNTNPEKIEKLATRDGFGRALVDAGKENGHVVVVCADLAESTRAQWFRDAFPDRYVEVGVAEQNLATVASGLAAVGKKPFMLSYAAFSPGRNNEQIRTTIALNDMPVVVVGCHAGISVGPDGATHQALEDVGLMRMIPNMTVVVPCDSNEAYKATRALATFPSPAYLRLGRSSVPVISSDQTPFSIGKGQVFFEAENSQVLIIACGALVEPALRVAQALVGEIACTVINLATIKPLDTDLILNYAQKIGAVVTAEEHQRAGGMGSAVAEFLASTHPVPMECIGVHDRFGQSGTPEELMKEYNLDTESIKRAVKKVLERKV